MQNTKWYIIYNKQTIHTTYCIRICCIRLELIDYSAMWPVFVTRAGCWGFCFAFERLCHETATMSREGQNENGISEEETTKDKSKRRGTRYNPFKRLRRREKHEDQPLVEFIPKSFKGVKPQRPSFGFGEESSEVATPISTHALKLFEAIREDEMDLVEDELASLTDKRQIDKLGGHGFALVHVAARYNFARIVATLLDHGADINSGTRENRWTPLHLAARCVQTIRGVSTLKFYRFRRNHWNLNCKNISLPTYNRSMISPDWSYFCTVHYHFLVLIEEW